MAAVSEKRIHEAFQLSVALKGLFAILECAVAVGLYFTTPETMLAAVNAIVHAELVEDPKDVVASYLLHAAQGFSLNSQHFAVWYLLIHGLVKLFLVAGLLREKYWAYPLSLIVLGLFVVYQLYRMTFAPSLALGLLTVFDVFVIALVWHEYGLRRRHLPVT